MVPPHFCRETGLPDGVKSAGSQVSLGTVVAKTKTMH